MRLEVDKTRCIGAGMCVFSAPGVFDQDDDGIVIPPTAEPELKDAPAVLKAVTACPSGALSLRE